MQRLPDSPVQPMLSYMLNDVGATYDFLCTNNFSLLNSERYLITLLSHNTYKLKY